MSAVVDLIVSMFASSRTITSRDTGLRIRFASARCLSVALFVLVSLDGIASGMPACRSARHGQLKLEGLQREIEPMVGPSFQPQRVRQYGEWGAGRGRRSVGISRRGKRRPG